MSRLLIVESPTKAKTIAKFLGSGYRVLSSFGHVRDLPAKALSVDTAKDFKPTYEIPERAKEHVAELKAAAKGIDEIYLATDEDREGEAIAWHIAAILKLDVKDAKRITFHEVTKTAIEHAMTTPRHLDMRLVHAQQARRILDRLVGYELSPLLWKKIQRGLSAGRVQSVAVRLIVERERERTAFNVEEYWTVDGEFKKDGEAFPGKLVELDGKKVDKMEIKDEASAKAIVARLESSKFAVTRVETKEAKKAPSPPFTTSSLQIEANGRLGMSAKQTMTLAQKLYETGRITYMRTDSVNLADKFLDEAQVFLKTAYGTEYAIGSQKHKTKKGAQEAHEAIRPTDVNLTPDTLPEKMDAGERKLYDLIWRRAVASQMPSAILKRTAVDIEGGKAMFRANGNAIAFEGFMKVYKSATERMLPILKQGDAVDTVSITPAQHFTEPPPRYSDATIVKVLEEHGIGRPSTYAPTISTVIDRGYVDRDENKKLFPTDVAYTVTDMLTEHFPEVVNYEFTAHMEQKLDDVADGKEEWVPMLKEFYGPFHKAIVEKGKSLNREDIVHDRELGIDPETKMHVYVKSGRYGAYVQLGEWSEEDKKAKINKPRSASLPRDASSENLTLEGALRLLELPRIIGKTEAGEEILANVGRFGPYLKVGAAYTSLPPALDPRTVTLEEARRTIAEGAARKLRMQTPLATLGIDPVTKSEVLVKDGRYGPYVSDGVTNATIPKKIDPMTVTLEMAADMLVKKRAAPKRPKFKRAAAIE